MSLYTMPSIVTFNILIYMDIKTLASMIQVNSKYKQMCMKQYFWKVKIQKDYPLQHLPWVDSNFKEIYKGEYRRQCLLENFKIQNEELLTNCSFWLCFDAIAQETNSKRTHAIMNCLFENKSVIAGFYKGYSFKIVNNREGIKVSCDSACAVAIKTDLTKLLAKSLPLFNSTWTRVDELFSFVNCHGFSELQPYYSYRMEDLALDYNQEIILPNIGIINYTIQCLLDFQIGLKLFIKTLPLLWNSSPKHNSIQNKHDSSHAKSILTLTIYCQQKLQDQPAIAIFGSHNNKYCQPFKLNHDSNSYFKLISTFSMMNYIKPIMEADTWRVGKYFGRLFVIYSVINDPNIYLKVQGPEFEPIVDILQEIFGELASLIKKDVNLVDVSALLKF